MTADEGHAIADGDRGQVTTVIKGRLADRGHAIGDGDGG